MLMIGHFNCHPSTIYLFNACRNLVLNNHTHSARTSTVVPWSWNTNALIGISVVSYTMLSCRLRTGWKTEKQIFISKVTRILWPPSVSRRRYNTSRVILGLIPPAIHPLPFTPQDIYQLGLLPPRTFTPHAIHPLDNHPPRISTPNSIHPPRQSPT